MSAREARPCARVPGPRRAQPEASSDAGRAAVTSAVLEGSTSTLAEVRDGAGDEVARDAVRVSTELLGLSPLLARAPLQALARIHALAGATSLRPDRLGRPRDAASAEHLRALAEILTAPTQAPALLVAGIAHAGLVTVAPFASHNGVVARAVERLVLVARGVDEKSLVVPEAGHLALRAAYESNLRGYRDGGSAGVHSWVLYAAEAFSAGAEASPLRRAAD